MAAIANRPVRRFPGFPRETAELLEHKGFGLHAELDPAALFTAKAVPFVIDRFREMKPVQQWLLNALA